MITGSEQAGWQEFSQTQTPQDAQRDHVRLVSLHCDVSVSMRFQICTVTSECSSKNQPSAESQSSSKESLCNAGKKIKDLSRI
jgi:hypothetical protein